MAFATPVSPSTTDHPRRHSLPGANARVSTTLLDLVRVLSEITDDENEIVATAIHMLRTGSVRVTGSFRDTPVNRFRG